jgi:hypothetical protein
MISGFIDQIIDQFSDACTRPEKRNTEIRHDLRGSQD